MSVFIESTFIFDHFPKNSRTSLSILPMAIIGSICALFIEATMNESNVFSVQ